MDHHLRALILHSFIQKINCTIIFFHPDCTVGPGISPCPEDIFLFILILYLLFVKQNFYFTQFTDGDRISIYTINILILSIYYIVLWIVFSLKLHYFFTIFHYFIVFANELSNAHISGLANTFARSSGSTSSATEPSQATKR